MGDSQRGFTLTEILGFDKGDSPAAQVRRIRLDLLYGGAENWETFSRLSVSDRYLWLVPIFEREVENGGLDQFLSNESGDYAVETLEALKAIGAVNCHRALRQACDLFPDGRPSEAFETRQKQVVEINDRSGRKIDEIVPDIGLESNLAELLLEFRKRNPAEPRSGDTAVR